MINRLILIFFIFVSVGCKTDNSENMTTKKTDTRHNKPGGIVFLRTHHLDSIVDFYMENVNCNIWLDQGKCKILKHGNMLFGFCESDKIDKEGVITFFYPEKSKVDTMYTKLQDVANHPPKMNPDFRIYHFYAKDPEGRSIEFQYFDHKLKDY